MKKVSVIIPCYNAEKWLNKCLDSVPKRDDIEIICIDDGSTDNTFNIMDNYFKKEKKFKNWYLYRNVSNCGVSYARNRGLEYAQGEYILMLDSDDYIYPKVFNKIVDNYLDSENDMVFYDMENNVK